LNRDYDRDALSCWCLKSPASMLYPDELRWLGLCKVRVV
jgi:hypothetical protein